MTRVREKVGLTTSLYSRYYDTPPGSWSEIINFGTVNNSVDHCTDTAHPDFNARKKRGELFMSPCTIEKVRSNTPYSSLLAVGPPDWGSRRFEGTLSSNFLIDVPEPSGYESDLSQIRVSLVNQCFAEAYASAADLMITIAEGNKTLQMMRKPLGTGRNMIAEMLTKKKRLIQRGFSAAKAVSNIWLEYRLGWKPVLYDIDNIMKASAEHLIDYKSTERNVARKTQTRNWVGINSTTLLSGPGYSSGLVNANKKVENKISAGVLYDKKLYSSERESSVRAIQNRFGLNLRNIALTGWELVPFSFVVDRFLDVNTWLKTIQPNPNISVLGSWRSEVRYSELESRLEWLRIDTTPPAITDRAHAHLGTRKTLTREVGVSPSLLPQLNFRELSLQQHSDHAALILNGLLRFKS